MNGQPAPGGGGGGDWRATVTEQARNQYLFNLTGSMLQGLAERQQEAARNIIAQHELQAFSVAGTVQEYMAILSKLISELRQKISALPGSQAANAAAGAMAQSAGGVSAAQPMLQGAQFSQKQSHAPTLTQAQLQAQAAQPPAPGPSPASASVPGQPGMAPELQKLRDIIQQPAAYSIEEITKVMHLLHGQASTGANTSGIMEIIKRLAIE
ncbi:hypothetical protein LPJ61_002629, partial [Coemansia biformis]